MKAIVQDRYGSAEDLRLDDVAQPTPRDDEVLIRVRATSVHADVWHVITGLPYVMRLMGAGVRRPKQRIPGTDLSGVVESIGKSVTRFRPGDEVFGETVRGIQWTNGGAFAEYAVAPESGLALKPAYISFEQAAAVPTTALIALQNLRDFGRLKAGMHVLINGAGGAVGTIAIQLAIALGARVTAVDRPEKLALLQTLGAEAVIDYTQEDFTRGQIRYDLILDIPGNHTFSVCRRALAPTGTYVLVGHDNYGKGMRRLFGVIPYMFRLMFMSLFIKQLPKPNISAIDKKASLEWMAELLAAGKLTPHIDRTFALPEVSAAMRYLQKGKAQGKIIVTVA